MWPITEAGDTWRSSQVTTMALFGGELAMLEYCCSSVLFPTPPSPVTEKAKYSGASFARFSEKTFKCSARPMKFSLRRLSRISFQDFLSSFITLSPKMLLPESTEVNGSKAGVNIISLRDQRNDFLSDVVF